MSKKTYSKSDRELEEVGDALYSRLADVNPHEAEKMRAALRSERAEGKPYLVIAKSATENTGTTSHFFTFADDEGQAIRIVQSHYNQRNDGDPLNISGRIPQYSQFTVKRVFESQPLVNARLFCL